MPFSTYVEITEVLYWSLCHLLMLILAISFFLLNVVVSSTSFPSSLQDKSQPKHTQHTPIVYVLKDVLMKEKRKDEDDPLTLLGILLLFPGLACLVFLLAGQSLVFLGSSSCMSLWLFLLLRECSACMRRGRERIPGQEEEEALETHRMTTWETTLRSDVKTCIRHFLWLHSVLQSFTLSYMTFTRILLGGYMLDTLLPVVLSVYAFSLCLRFVL